MGWLPVVIAAVAAVISYRNHQMVIFSLSIVVLIGAFWSWGIMHNFATEEAKKRSSYRGGFFDIKPNEAIVVPDWITWINMAFSLAAALLLILAFLNARMVPSNLRIN